VHVALRTLEICERFGCLPSALAGEDTELLRMLAIERMVKGDDDGE
jgi:hypothetical protein